ncbi:MAG: type III-A CRISPR-associated RAMP protein Csm4 [Candidatus Aenigmarchaeota archaeon ex4484_52]|nr:MAG: type III-A CRISPR-associated RAMP protein Csm4 [Candidatus Aenigmarchaeota archaeon ex4484_52]
MTLHTAFKIKFKSPVFGQIDSIKIYGAILNALYLLDETKAEQFKQDSINKQIKISSAFPIKDNIYFFPMPILNYEYSKKLSNKIEAEGTPNKTFNKLKKIKKIQYISKSIFEELINKNYDLEQLEEKINIIEKPKKKINLNELETEKWHLIKKYLITFDEFKEEKPIDNIPQIKPMDMPRNELNRYNLNSNIFYSPATIYKNCELYFLAKTNNEEQLQLIKFALNFLQDRGLGQDNSVGFGQFKFEKTNEFKLKEPDKTDKIKIILDENEKRKNYLHSYKSEEIKGFNKNGLHIYPMVYLKEGSCISPEVKGKILKIRDNFLINGICYPINIHRD